MKQAVMLLEGSRICISDEGMDIRFAVEDQKHTPPR
jgi:hypothetical protein